MRDRRNKRNASASVQLTGTPVKRYPPHAMKAETHPEYFPDATVTCSCGHVFTVGSTKKEISVEICAACHPFYTGQKKYVDARGRVERFSKIAEKSAQVKAMRDAQKAAPKKKKNIEVLTERQWRKLG